MGCVTSRYGLSAVAAILIALLVMRVGEARRRAASEARTHRLGRRILGTVPDVRFLRGPNDTVQPGRLGSTWVLVYVTAPGCPPSRRLARSGVRAEPWPLEVWVASRADGDQIALLQRLGAPVHMVRPVDDSAFRDRYAADEIPYLALLDSVGMIRRVHVEYAEGMAVESVLSPGR